MNLTPAERAAMVRDLQELANKYARLELIAGTRNEAEFADSMFSNYSALASALKEGLTFQATA